jgi:hypothetical protein
VSGLVANSGRAQEEALRRLHEKLFPSDSTVVLESDG